MRMWTRAQRADMRVQTAMNASVSEWASSVLLAPCLLVTVTLLACGETAPAPPYGGTTAPSPQARPATVEPAEEAPAPKTAAPAAKVNPDHKRLAEVHAAIQCAEAQFKAHDAKRKAVEAALTRVAMTRAELDDAVAELDGNEAFHTLRSAAVAECEGRKPKPSGVKAKDPATSASALAVDSELLERIKSLAIESECLRRSGLQAEVLKTKMISLYKSYEIPLQTYAKEMTRLASNRAFQDDVDAGVEVCTNKVRAEQAAAAEAAAAAAAAAAPNEAPPATEKPVAELIPPSAKPIDPDQQPNEPVAVNAGTDKPAAPTRTSGTYNGTIVGKHKGTLMVRLRNNSVASASVRINGVRISLKGTFARNQLVLGGRKGSDYFKLRGKLNPKKARISGTWDGAIKRKLMRGKFVMRR